jgi:hypothetical protein
MSKTKFDFRAIKSYEDACRALNIDPEQLPVVNHLPEDLRKALIAAYKLYIVFKAINNGWIPNWFDHKQYKYFPWFEVEASKELSSGFGFSDSDCDCASTDAGVGSRLCTDTSEKALYIANQFESEYKDFLLIS